MQAILLHIRHNGIPVKQRTALKMQVQAAKVHINGAHHCRFVITDIGLGMKESRRVLVMRTPAFKRLG